MMKKLIAIFFLCTAPVMAQDKAPKLNLPVTVSISDTVSLKNYAVTLDSAIVELQRQADALATLAKQHRAKAVLLKRKRTLILNLVKTERKAK